MRFEEIRERIVNNPGFQTLKEIKQAGYRIVKERDGERYFLARPEELKPLLVRLGDIAEVHGYIHDNNIGKNFEKAPLLRSLKHAKSIKVNKKSDGVIFYGVKEEGKSRLIGQLLFARTFGGRLLILLNEDNIFAKEFYKIIIKIQINDNILAAISNSCWFFMQMELYGNATLGGGALKFSGNDITLITILSLEIIKKNSNTMLLIFNKLANRPIKSVFEELGFKLCRIRSCSHHEHPYENVRPEELTLERVKQASPDRYELDRIVFDILGLTDEERLAVYRAVVDLVKTRLVKARSV